MRMVAGSESISLCVFRSSHKPQPEASARTFAIIISNGGIVKWRKWIRGHLGIQSSLKSPPFGTYMVQMYGVRLCRKHYILQTTKYMLLISSRIGSISPVGNSYTRYSCQRETAAMYHRPRQSIHVHPLHLFSVIRMRRTTPKIEYPSAHSHPAF